MNRTHTPVPRGFTLIELLVVIAIISLLSAVILSALSSARTKAREARRGDDMHSLVTALQLYANEHNGLYPAASVVSGTDTACGGVNRCVHTLASALSPYMPAMPDDPEEAGTAYNYRYSADSTGSAYILLRYSELSSNYCVVQTGVAFTGTGPSNWGPPTYPWCS